MGNFNTNFCKFAIDRFHHKWIHFTGPERECINEMLQAEEAVVFAG
jgi:hypothetical protein